MSMNCEKNGMDDDDESINPLLLVLGGAIAGSTLALLFAPQSGRETRRDLEKLGRSALTSAERFQTELRAQVEELVRTVVDTGSQSLEKGRALTDKIRDEVLATLENGCKVLEEEISKVQQRFR